MIRRCRCQGSVTDLDGETGVAIPDRMASAVGGGVIQWSMRPARMLARVFTEIVTRALRILERPFLKWTSI
jgi:hypothetical protein